MQNNGFDAQSVTLEVLGYGTDVVELVAPTYPVSLVRGDEVVQEHVSLVGPIKRR